MNTFSSNVLFFLQLARSQSAASRRFDAGLLGLSMNDFMILHALSMANDGKMRRIDLAEQVGLTASGITRLLAPMEKIGLIKREAHSTDARVSFVALAPSGKRKLHEAVENAEDIAKNLLQTSNKKDIDAFIKILQSIR